jgi:hypothetical protein
MVSEYGGPNDYFVELQVLLGLALIQACRPTKSHQGVSEYGGPNDYFVELQVLLGLALISGM